MSYVAVQHIDAVAARTTELGAEAAQDRSSQRSLVRGEQESVGQLLQFLARYGGDETRSGARNWSTHARRLSFSNHYDVSLGYPIHCTGCGFGPPRCERLLFAKKDGPLRWAQGRGARNGGVRLRDANGAPGQTSPPAHNGPGATSDEMISAAGLALDQSSEQMPGITCGSPRRAYACGACGLPGQSCASLLRAAGQQEQVALA